MLHSWLKYNSNEIYANYNRFCHPVTTATNYINFTWIRVPGCVFFSHLKRANLYLSFSCFTGNKTHKQIQERSFKLDLRELQNDEWSRSMSSVKDEGVFSWRRNDFIHSISCSPPEQKRLDVVQTCQKLAAFDNIISPIMQTRTFQRCLFFYWDSRFELNCKRCYFETLQVTLGD